MEKMSEEPKPGVSKKRVIEESSSSGEEIDPSCIMDELLQKYASEMPSEIPMTISEELFIPTLWCRESMNVSARRIKSNSTK